MKVPMISHRSTLIAWLAPLATFFLLGRCPQTASANSCYTYSVVNGVDTYTFNTTCANNAQLFDEGMREIGANSATGTKKDIILSANTAYLTDGAYLESPTEWPTKTPTTGDPNVHGFYVYSGWNIKGNMATLRLRTVNRKYKDNSVPLRFNTILAGQNIQTDVSVNDLYLDCLVPPSEVAEPSAPQPPPPLTDYNIDDADPTFSLRTTAVLFRAFSQCQIRLRNVHVSNAASHRFMRPFVVQDLQNPLEFAKTIRDRATSISLFIYNTLQADSSTSAPFNSWAVIPNPTTVPANVVNSLVTTLNKLVRGPSIWNPARFSGVVLRPQTTAIRDSNPLRTDLLSLNRLLLEDAYPTATGLLKNPYVVSPGGDNFEESFIVYFLSSESNPALADGTPGNPKYNVVVESSSVTHVLGQYSSAITINGANCRGLVTNCFVNMQHDLPSPFLNPQPTPLPKVNFAHFGLVFGGSGQGAVAPTRAIHLIQNVVTNVGRGVNADTEYNNDVQVIGNQFMDAMAGVYLLKAAQGSIKGNLIKLADKPANSATPYWGIAALPAFSGFGPAYLGQGANNLFVANNIISNGINTSLTAFSENFAIGLGTKAGGGSPMSNPEFFCAGSVISNNVMLENTANLSAPGYDTTARWGNLITNDSANGTYVYLGNRTNIFDQNPPLDSWIPGAGWPAGAMRGMSFLEEFEGVTANPARSLLEQWKPTSPISGATHSAQVVSKPGSTGKAVRFSQVRQGGDLFSMPLRAPANAQEVWLEFSYLGLNPPSPTITSGGFAGLYFPSASAHGWLAGTITSAINQFPGWTPVQLFDNPVWSIYRMNILPVLSLYPNQPFQVMLQDWNSGTGAVEKDAYFDNVRVRVVPFPFSEDFESGLTQWTYAQGAFSYHSGRIVPDPVRPGNKVLNFGQVRIGGDIVTRIPIQIPSPVSPGPGQPSPLGSRRVCLEFEYYGFASSEYSGGYIGLSWTPNPSQGHGWVAGTDPGPVDGFVGFAGYRLPSVTSTWIKVTLDITSIVQTYSRSDFHLLLEDWSGSGATAANAFFDNIRVKVSNTCQ
ncbi:MAG: hypothetical protein IT581_02010 [Verrucomicrobiales bacterium]|nr:hypothetical protein [Verrucomicrobiales bacterium]